MMKQIIRNSIVRAKLTSKPNINIESEGTGLQAVQKA